MTKIHSHLMIPNLFAIKVFKWDQRNKNLTHKNLPCTVAYHLIRIVVDYFLRSWSMPICVRTLTKKNGTGNYHICVNLKINRDFQCHLTFKMMQKLFKSLFPMILLKNKLTKSEKYWLETYRGDLQHHQIRIGFLSNKLVCFIY